MCPFWLLTRLLQDGVFVIDLPFVFVNDSPCLERAGMFVIDSPLAGRHVCHLRADVIVFDPPVAGRCDCY